MMNFKWIDYSPTLAETVDSFLDKKAVKMTGIDEGFENYYSYWANEENTVVGQNFWCKVVFRDNAPVGVVAIGKAPSGEFILSEMIVSPTMRGMGLGSAVLCELLTDGKAIIGQSINSAMSVIYPDNLPSQRCFEKAGFAFSSAHPDGDAWYYKFTAK